MSDQPNDFAGDKLEVPRAEVRSRAVGQQLRADGSEASACAVAPAQQKFLFVSILRTMALRSNKLEGHNRSMSFAKSQEI